nr:DNA cytosine methyltransferase [Lactococcus chungangensis]
MSDILEEKVDEKYFLSKERCEKFIWKNERIGVLPYKTGKLPQRCKVVRENGLSPTLLASFAHEPQMVAIRNNSPNKPFLAAQNGDNISLQPNARGSVRKGYSGTITTSPDAVLDDWRIRKLTPRECWRLQSMPEWAFDRAQKVCSDQQLYKQAGNGVTVNVVREIAKKLK